MVEGFLIGLAFWVGPALVAWIIFATRQVGRHSH